MDAPVELVNLRLALAAPGSELPRPAAERVVDGRPMEQVLPAGLEAPVPVWRTTDLPTGRPLDGPLLVADAVATVWVEPGWRLLRLDEGTLLMEQTKKPQS
ncbi:MAG TPA: hypothetical protein ENJ79_04895 [Gammaproteobacteria bacterium]|nr:hypothetical protein [Gammaproteobacteria bacterium]